jgi:putative membrane protein
MTRIGYAAAALATAFFVSSGSAQTPAPGSQTSPRPGSPGTQTSAPSGSTSASALDNRSFVEKMTIVNLAEVQLGRMAEKQGQDEDVKEFGRQMVKDHQAANENLQQIATKLSLKGAMELDAKHKELADKLSKLQGAAFDREYIAAMVQGHEEVRSILRAKIGSEASSETQGAREVSRSGRPTTSPGQVEVGRGVGPGGTVAPSTGTPAPDQASPGSQTHSHDDLTKWAQDTLRHVEEHLEDAREIQKTLTSQ